ncbi:MAG: phage major capsid protein, P2 family [Enterobacter sp.]|uniref:phage major capsid protein, P2 family n=1 Tax=Enterobacter sp. TaxID=42895 RepID=UPI0029008F12|nr:phage major capsid protein, P2 family [Enterobacter sp.]MDU2767851.1 phage major capsid protein, P2 family [Enterobacter sp.]MDU2782141.1 phage major capsid protein, P2 family [Enterobacter sp.]MDU2842370.1 phage major capsid protein, P2 family [Enterobacter sp.]
MKKKTRFAFNAYLQQLAKLNGIDVGDIGSKYTAEPSIAQTLETKIQESSAFLTRINIVPVDEQSGERLGLGIGSTVAGTTDTTKKEREPTDPTYIDGEGYKCTQTNFDTALGYEKLDLWAKFEDFQIRIRDAIIKRQALDRIMIGFNGERREKTSDRLTYPLLQDVNIGWLEKIRREAPVRVLSRIVGSDGTVISQTVRIGKGGDFKNLDALVMGAVSEKIEPWYQDDTELVVICGRSLMADKYFPIVNRDQPNSEALAADLIISQKRIGGLPAVQAPFFPANAILITRLDNLSIYWQDGTRRRAVIDNPKRDRIENFESVNEAYVIEDYDCVALIENIEVLETEDAPAQQTAAADMSDEQLARIVAMAATVVQSMNASTAPQAAEDPAGGGA